MRVNITNKALRTLQMERGRQVLARNAREELFSRMFADGILAACSYTYDSGVRRTTVMFHDEFCLTDTDATREDPSPTEVFLAKILLKTGPLPDRDGADIDRLAPNRKHVVDWSKRDA